MVNILSVTFVLCSFSTAEVSIQCQEVTVVSCQSGREPGQYYFMQGAGYNLVPRTFSIDPNNGSFYIPEADTHHRIRLHEFDSDGKFKRMIELEGKTDRIADMSVGLNGVLYLVLDKVALTDSYVCCYDRKGRLIKRIGPKGPITRADLDAEKEAEKMHHRNPVKDKYFQKKGRVSIIDNKLYVVRRDSKRNEIYRFDGRSGQLIEKGQIVPKALEDKHQVFHAKRKMLRDWLKLQGRESKAGLTHSLIGPDGHLYYMSVTKEKLEIRRVLFPK